MFSDGVCLCQAHLNVPLRIVSAYLGKFTSRRSSVEREDYFLKRN